MLAVNCDQNNIYEIMNFYQARKINEMRNVKCSVSYLVSISSILQIRKDIQHYKQYVMNNESPEDFLATVRNGTFSQQAADNVDHS